MWRYAGLAVALCVCSVPLSYGAVLLLPQGKGISGFYFASIFYALTTYWFGGWGLVAAYVGSVVGVGFFNGQPATVAFLFSLANVIEPLVPFLLVRRFGSQVGMHPLGTNIARSPASMMWFLLFGALLPPFLSGLWGVTVLRTAGQPTPFWASVGDWWAGASILLTVGMPFLGRLFGPYVDRSRIGCQGVWS
jgi:integral membrane sensor domain MASE1